jgi:hypothetical protein
VMATPDPDAEPWKSFWSDVKQCQGPNEARVFLVGSIFGGTGAAGVPTFGARDMIKRHPDARLEDGSKVLLGGALVLPYFTFETPESPPLSAEGRPEMYVTPADFPIATQAALQFYHEKELGFDQLYFVGDSLAQRVGAFSHGNRGQENRPHYIELVTALAAFDFFAQDEVPSGSDARYFYACREGRVVDWRALPATRHAERVAERENAVKLAMCTMTAFAYALATEGRAVLERPHDRVDDRWYRRNFAFSLRRAEDAGRDPRQHAQRAAIAAVEEFGRDFLEWICALDEEGGEVRLVDRSKLFADARPDAASPHLLPPREHLSAIGEFVKGTRQGRDFAAFLNLLGEVEIGAAEMPASNRWFNLFYEASMAFCAAAYNLPLPTRPA